MRPQDYAVNRRWRALLADVGVDPVAVLRSAHQPLDLFELDEPRLAAPDMFQLWLSLEREIADPLLPLRIAHSLTVEAFDTAIFAATCSRDLASAAERIAAHKPLIGPTRLSVERNDAALRIELAWPATLTPPASMALTELTFWVALARLTTGARVTPAAMTSPEPPVEVDAYHDYLGVTIRRAEEWSISFSAADAARPFVMANEAMWASFEPRLRRRLDDLDRRAGTADRVRAVLLELLPAGEASVDAVGAELGLGVRTLQRRLRAEGSGFTELVNQTREALARHYLRHTKLPVAEISFLLGYDDYHSFYRAFHSWTGSTPRAVRRAA